MLVLNTFSAGVVWNSKLWNFMQFHHGDQGGFDCGASTQANSIQNYFISKFFKVPKISLKLPKFPLKFSISSQPGWQAGTIKVTLIQEKEFTNRNTWVVKQKLMMKTASKCQTVWIYSSQSWWEWTLGCGLDHENKSSLHFIVSSKILPLYVHWQAGKARLAPGRKIIVEER